MAVSDEFVEFETLRVGDQVERAYVEIEFGEGGKGVGPAGALPYFDSLIPPDSANGPSSAEASCY